MMRDNVHQLKDMVQLASDLGVDQLNFKQCDVIRYDHGTDLGLYTKEENRSVKQYKKHLDHARKLARKLKLRTTASAFTPDEQPVCDQNPCRSMFISYDGVTAPCINLAMGGPAEFMGTAVTFPTVQYGSVLEKNIKELWESETCRNYRKSFQRRDQIYDRAFQNAASAMSEAPEGCGTCHYLYGI